MPERVDARDVLDANACMKRPVRGAVIGYFRRAGPNPWDDYEFVRDDQGALEVYPGVEIQIERSGTDFRMRKDGRVIRVRWTPSSEDPDDLRGRTSLERRSYFVQRYLQDYDDVPGMGAAAVIARKLTHTE